MLILRCKANLGGYINILYLHISLRDSVPDSLDLGKKLQKLFGS